MSFKRPFEAVPIKLGERYRAKARHEKRRRFVLAAVVLISAAIVGGFVGALPSSQLSILQPGYDDTVSSCTVTDGDTIRCNGERIRLLGIDTPELPGHCRIGRNCLSGDPYTSSLSLGAAMVGVIRIQRVGEDRYGRTLATLSSDKGDLSCWQLQHGQAAYKPQWDDRKRVLRTCPRSALL